MNGANRPNILLIQADQLRQDCLGVNGHPFARTPHLDALAEEGSNFSRAFCTIPLCVPSRNSMLHGLWPTQHHCIANVGTEAGRPPDDGLISFTQILRRAGYHLEHIGQWHVHPAKTPADYGFDIFTPLEAYPPWRASQGCAPKPSRNRWFGEVDPHIAPEQSRIGWGATETIGALRRAARGDKPFFIQWDLEEPHLPNILPEPYASMYSPEAVPPWPSFPDTLEGKPYIQGQQRRTWRVDDWTWDQWAPIVARYLGEVSLIDSQVGRILDEVTRLGLKDDMLVVFTSDHGDLCGAHGMIDKHYVLYDDVVRVPLIIRWPDRFPAGRACDAFVSSSIDLSSTFCEAAGLPVPAVFEGQSLMPLLHGLHEGRQDIFCTYHGNQFGLYSQRMVRGPRWKYIWNATAEDELYDLASDPAELTNRALDPSAAEPLSRLRRRLVDWMEQTRDPLLNEWTRRQILEGLSR